VTSKITDTDRGLNAVAARLVGKHRVRVGILADAPKASDQPGAHASLLEVAAIHEFGAPQAGIPQRSFVRATVDNKRSEIEAAQATLAKQIVEGKIDGETAMERLGAKVEGLMKGAISAGIAPPNAPSTIARKGSSKPLVDTGQLKSAITYQTEEV
jgi:phage gpG-like protein